VINCDEFTPPMAIAPTHPATAPECLYRARSAYYRVVDESEELPDSRRTAVEALRLAGIARYFAFNEALDERFLAATESLISAAESLILSVDSQSEPTRQPPSDRDWNVYILFVLYAVHGPLSAADGILQQHGSEVRRAAAYLRYVWPIEPNTLYRGLLIERTEVSMAKGRLVMRGKPPLAWVSASVDRNVACWFASASSKISSVLTLKRPAARGYVLELPVGEQTPVLWHHDWFYVPTPRPLALAVAAQLHPDIDVDQFQWSWLTQREVILDRLPAKKGFLAVPVDEACSDRSVEELDQLFWPRWAEEDDLQT
jgi:hypothetical protein